MRPGQLDIIAIGASTCLRPAFAAAAVALALGEEVRVLALTSADGARVREAHRLIEQVTGRSVPLLAVSGSAATAGFDLVIAVDDLAGEQARQKQRDPAAGHPADIGGGGQYRLSWPGPEPAGTPDEMLAAFEELRAHAEQLVAGSLVRLLRASRNRRGGTARPRSPERPEARRPEVFHGLVGASEPMQLLYKAIRKTARMGNCALIHGETGSGKELVARAIHAESARRDKPFVAINCAAMPQEVFESELFGHRRGAFTGATSDRLGQFRAAEGGTLFLDEIGDLPLPLQAKLLRVLETREVRPVGADAPVRVDVRVLAATHRDLARGVREGWFREDLFYRLAVAVLEVPPLRQHLADLPHIAEHLLEGLRRETGRAYAPISATTLEEWSRFSWPGNVRQLSNLVVGAAVHASGLDLPLARLQPGAGAADGARKSARRLRHPRLGERVLTVQSVVAALQQAHGNRTRAAATLGISRSTLYRFLDEHPHCEPS